MPNCLWFAKLRENSLVTSFYQKEVILLLYTVVSVRQIDDINPLLFFFSFKQFIDLVRQLDVNMDTISTKVNAALTRLEKKFDVMLALYQRFEK